MTPKLIPALVLIASISASASGCGGSVPLPPGLENPPSPYRNLSDIFAEGGNVTLGGESRTGDYEGNPATGPVTASGSVSRTNYPNASLKIEAQRGKNANFTYTQGGTSISYEETDAADSIAATSDSSIAASTDRLSYTLYGVWLIGVGERQFSLQASSFGRKTRNPGRSDIPRKAKYTGSTRGFHRDSAGQMRFTESDLTADVNFEGIPLVEISSTGTKTRSISESISSNSASLTPAPELDFDGSARFSGVEFDMELESGAGSLSGSFYGESAENVGGTFHIDKGGGAAYGGSFGAER